MKTEKESVFKIILIESLLITDTSIFSNELYHCKRRLYPNENHSVN